MWLTLVSFLLALLAGVFLHPVQECQFHVCDAPTGHVERDHGPDQDHGAHTCGLCHLAQTVASATCATPAPTSLGLADQARTNVAASAQVLASATPRRLACRGPPTA